MSRRCDSTHDRFRVVAAGFSGMNDRKWLTDHLPEDGSAQLHDATSAWTMIGIWGPRARDRRRVHHRRRPCRRGVPVRHLPDHRHRLAPNPGRAHQLRRRARLGDPRADGAGSAAVGPPVGGRPAPRHRARRARRLRDLAAPREELPRHGQGIRARPEPGRGGHGAADGQEGRLRGQGGVPAPARDGARGAACARSRWTTPPRSPGSGATCSGGEPILRPGRRPLVDHEDGARS